MLMIMMLTYNLLYLKFSSLQTCNRTEAGEAAQVKQQIYMVVCTGICVDADGQYENAHSARLVSISFWFISLQCNYFIVFVVKLWFLKESFLMFFSEYHCVI
ncbi:hypothetical protein E2542_SST17049 [Spatholobus suberectus]|nr:hypothetical protein E2542_SST17049 [Spatholobus suberectus]